MAWLFELHSYLDKVYQTNPTLITLAVIAAFLALFLSSRNLSRSKAAPIALGLLAIAAIIGIAVLSFGG